MTVYSARNLVAGDVSDNNSLAGSCSGFRILNRSGGDVVLCAIAKAGGASFTMTFPSGVLESVDIALAQIKATGSSNLLAAGVEFVLRGNGL